MKLFSFDLPEELFRLYSKRAEVTVETLAAIKGQEMSEFYGYYRNRDGLVRLIEFRLDMRWYETVLEHLEMN